MLNKNLVIEKLLNRFSEIRYVAIYLDKELVLKEREKISNSSSGNSDQYEELLVNPTLLTLARQRGDIDCGGLRYIIVGYGNFYQFVKEMKDGHISICLDITSNPINLANEILSFLNKEFPALLY